LGILLILLLLVLPHLLSLCSIYTLLYRLHVLIHIISHFTHLSLKHAFFHGKLLDILLLNRVYLLGLPVHLRCSQLFILESFSVLSHRGLLVLELSQSRLHLLQLIIFCLKGCNGLRIGMRGCNLLLERGIYRHDWHAAEVVHRIALLSGPEEVRRPWDWSCVLSRWSRINRDECFQSQLIVFSIISIRIPKKISIRSVTRSHCKYCLDLLIAKLSRCIESWEM
jgi:hypothetical protein